MNRRPVPRIVNKTGADHSRASSAPGHIARFVESAEIQPLRRDQTNDRETNERDVQPWLRPLMTQQEAAQVLRISTRQVQIEIAKGRLRAVRIGRRTLLNHDDLHEFIRIRSGFQGDQG